MKRRKVNKKGKEAPTRKRSTILILNILFGIATWLFLQNVVLKQKGYAWVIDMLKENMAMIKEHPKIPLEHKYEIKLGRSYRFMYYLKDNTPSDAVLYIPAASVFLPEGKESPYKNGEPYNKLWATRFLYPRKIVTADEASVSSYFNKITHVAIVNGEGFDMLPYSFEHKFTNGCMPMDSTQL